MNDKLLKKRDYESIAWGAFFIWWGTTELLPSLPNGTGAIGIGLILLGLSAARYFTGIATSRFTTTIGILSVVWGVLELAGELLNLPFDIPIFAILLVVLGGIVLARGLFETRNESVGGL